MEKQPTKSKTKVDMEVLNSLESDPPKDSQEDDDRFLKEFDEWRDKESNKSMHESDAFMLFIGSKRKR